MVLGFFLCVVFNQRLFFFFNDVGTSNFWFLKSQEGTFGLTLSALERVVFMATERDGFPQQPMSYLSVFFLGAQALNHILI